MPDRRTMLTGAAATAALVASAGAPARATQAAPGSNCNMMGRRERTMSGGGLSASRLARMRDAMFGHVARGQVPGLVTLVSRRGEAPVDAGGLKGGGGSGAVGR